MKGFITLVGQGADAAAITTDKNNKQVIFKNYALFTNCISDMNNTQVDNTIDLDALIPMYTLMEYRDN